MKSEHPKTTTILLKDGEVLLESWPQEFSELPTVGEKIDISGKLPDELEGYREQAMVTRIEWDQESDNHRIEAEADCELADHERPIVFLNASMIPASRRRDAEQLLRRELQLPILHWEESYEPKPIVRLHDNGKKLTTSLAELQKKLGDLFKGPMEMAPR